MLSVLLILRASQDLKTLWFWHLAARVTISSSAVWGSKSRRAAKATALTSQGPNTLTKLHLRFATILPHIVPLLLSRAGFVNVSGFRLSVIDLKIIHN